MATRLLLVENEPSLLDLLERYLTRSGYLVSKAPNAECTLALLSVVPPRTSTSKALDTAVANKDADCASESLSVDLAIVDLTFSDGMTGVDLLKAFRASGHNFPVLLYSGYPFSVETLAPELQKNVWYLQKPFLPSVLSQAVAGILESGKAVSAEVSPP